MNTKKPCRLKMICRQLGAILISSRYCFSKNVVKRWTDTLQQDANISNLEMIGVLINHLVLASQSMSDPSRMLPSVGLGLQVFLQTSAVLDEKSYVAHDNIFCCIVNCKEINFEHLNLHQRDIESTDSSTSSFKDASTTFFH